MSYSEYCAVAYICISTVLQLQRDYFVLCNSIVYHIAKMTDTKVICVVL